MLGSSPLTGLPDPGAVRQVPATPAPRREAWLDGVRGLLLVLMALNHIDSPLRLLTFQTFGYASAAEGFLFVSGLTVGLVYTRRWLARGRPAMVSRAMRRVVAIYACHVLPLVAILALSRLAPAWIGELPLVRPDPGPAAALAPLLVSSLTLLYQPLLFDILPLYVLSVAVAPWILVGFDRGWGRRIGVASAGLWLLAQWSPPSAWVYALGDRLPVWRSGFDWAAFQVLFVSGLYLGHRWARGETLPPSRTMWPWHGAALVVAVAGFLLRIAERLATGPLQWQALGTAKNGFLGLVASLATDQSVFGRPVLAPGRLMNVAALIVVCLLLAPYLRRLVEGRWLTLLGRHALALYAIHVVCVYVMMPVTRPLRGRWHFGGPFSAAGIEHAGWALLLLTLLTGVAFLLDRRHADARRH